MVSRAREDKIMAITQKDIIDQIPFRIYTSYHPFMPDSGNELLILRSLCHAGWGVKSKLYKVLNEMLSLTHENTEKNIFIFHEDNMSCLPLVCEKCNDSGYFFNNDVKTDLTRYPCTECEINKPKRGELGKVLDAIKAYKKLPNKLTSTVIDDAMKDCNFCVSVELKVWRLIKSVVNQSRPLAYISNVGESITDKSITMTDEEANAPHECSCCKWTGLGGDLVVGVFDFYCCPACDSACVSEINLS